MIIVLDIIKEMVMGKYCVETVRGFQVKDKQELIQSEAKSRPKNQSGK